VVRYDVNPREAPGAEYTKEQAMLVKRRRRNGHQLKGLHPEEETMALRLLVLVVLACLTVPASGLAQQPTPYAVPRTEHGHPDFQGVWATAFLTMLERPPGVETLIVGPAQAEALGAMLRKGTPAVVDPDFQLHDIQRLAMVKGQYRTSIIVDPEDGRMPFTKAGLDLAGVMATRDQSYDHPEERPLVDRCLENLGYAPMRAVPVFLPRMIVQTRDHVAIYSEDAVGLRLIHLRGQAPPAAIRTIQGYSAGRWEQDTLVVQTTHFSANYPARNVIGRPLLLTPRTTVTERFTRVSPTELFYQYTVEDAELYTRPWKGEFSMTRQSSAIYEYGCHEGNYSLVNSLRGGQADAARRIEAARDPR
jgi:hypothetical protein